MRLQIEVQVRRGAIEESRHRLHLAVSDAEGRVLADTDSPPDATTFRSAAKPFQLLPLVERGHADAFGFEEADLAIMAASHTGSEAHLDRVRAILARIGCAESDLACGFHEPVDADALKDFREYHRPPTALYNNCSGKHAGMLAMCRAENWPTAGYQHAEHPLQQLLHRTVAEVCGLPIERVATAIDGCSVPVFAMPLGAMARGYARLAAAAPDGDARTRGLDRIRHAMTAHPWATGGRGRFSTALMEAVPRLVAKGGAEGLECVGSTERGLGLALKCDDGATRAVAPAMVAVLEHLGWIDPAEADGLRAWQHPILHNHAGLEVGTLEPAVRVLAGTTG